MESPVDAQKPAEVAAERSKNEGRSTVDRFPIGSLVPINGVWFKIAEVKAEGLLLSPVGFTKKGRKP